MKKLPPAIRMGILGLVAFVLVAVHTESGGQVSQPKTSAKLEGFGISLRTDKHEYRPGDPIQIVLEVFNDGDQRVTFDFGGSQRYDFWIEEKGGKEIWRWSTGRVFLQILGKEMLGPRKRRLEYRVQHKEKVPPGVYQVKGKLTARRPMSAVVTVVVR